MAVLNTITSFSLSAITFPTSAVSSRPVPTSRAFYDISRCRETLGFACNTGGCKQYTSICIVHMPFSLRKLKIKKNACGATPCKNNPQVVPGDILSVSIFVEQRKESHPAGKSSTVFRAAADVTFRSQHTQQSNTISPTRRHIIPTLQDECRSRNLLIRNVRRYQGWQLRESKRLARNPVRPLRHMVLKVPNGLAKYANVSEYMSDDVK